MKSAVLLWSGGADSTLCAMLLRERGIAVHALSVHYAGRPAGEIAAAQALAAEMEFASAHEMRLDGLAMGPPAWLVDPAAHHEGFVPYRNLVFWSLAANRAAAVGADAIAAGHTRYDAECYDDAGPAFFASLAAPLNHSGLGKGGRPVAVELPLALLSPQEMADLLLRHREFLRRTWSCWRDGTKPCGVCYACTERTFEALQSRPR